MKVWELIGYSRRLLKGRRMKTMMICILPLAGELFFRFAEICVYSLLLYFSGMKPIALFSGESRIQQGAALILTVLRWVVLAPLMYAAAYRLYEISGEKRRRSVYFSRIILSRRIYKRSLAALILTKILSFAALIPMAFFGVTAYTLLISSQTAGELFMTAHAIVMTLAAAVMWLSLKLSLAAVPFLLVRFPEKSVLRVVVSSLRFMKGRRITLLKLLTVYIPPMLTVVAIPVLLPELMTAYSLSIDIYIKEDEYLEGIKADRRAGLSHDAGTLSAGQEGRFAPSPEQA